MPIIIDGVTLENGAPLLVGGVQAQNVMCNGVEVWVNNYVADAPTTFDATNSVNANIDFTWVLPADQGVPACSYEVRRSSDDVVVATAVVGATTAQLVTTVSENQDFYVVGVNAAGSGAVSNSDNGTSYVGAASPITITADTTFIAGTNFPAVASVNVCICGGGGSGGAMLHDSGDAINQGMGGYAGNPASVTVNVPFGESVVVDIGGGGSGVGHAGYSASGHAGGATTFGAHASAAGGAGGGTRQCGGTASYAGNGGARTTCLGTANDGTTNETSGGNCGKSAAGGQSSGYANGGNGGLYGAGGAGGTGSGGGGSMNSSSAVLSGAGGAGVVVISW